LLAVWVTDGCKKMYNPVVYYNRIVTSPLIVLRDPPSRQFLQTNARVGNVTEAIKENMP